MPLAISVQAVHSRILAAVDCEVSPSGVASAWKPALDKVWAFLRTQPGLRTNGHNVFLYHQPTQPWELIRCEFGVEVTRTFARSGDVYASQTPAGEAAVAIHRGPYSRLRETHAAIAHWMAANDRQPAGQSWEIYGDPTPDEAQTETTVGYLLK